MIKSQGLTKTFRSGFLWWKTEVPVLKGFDFVAYPGQVTGLLGPNGAGKTTFFRILCGLEKPSGGVLEVDGLDPALHPEHMRGKIALLPEDPGVPLEMSGYRHLWIYAVMMGMDEAQIKQSIDQADQILQMSSYWNRPFRNYSRGQKARIALARMNLMPNASVLIFDEPSNGLDFQAVTQLHAFIRQLASEGKTILVASHILSDLKHLCDRMVGLDNGQQATTETLNAWLKNHERTQAIVKKFDVMELL